MLPSLPGAGTAPLSPDTRQTALERLGAETFDLLVVGGGVVGAGSALDAATRGLSVALVEARDFAAGTSSRSSKLIHGGLRYLEQLDFHLVREALVERGLLLERLAPHLVRPLPFLLPLTHPVWERAYLGAGVLLYDALAATGRTTAGLPHHRHLSRRAALRLFPGLRPDALVGAIRFYDAQVDDARHTLMVARTAAAYGAVVANRAQVVRVEREAGRVVGATVADLDAEASAGATIPVRARVVLDATGVWTEDVEGLAGAAGSVRVRASKGVHLVVPAASIEGQTALILRTETSVLFVLPWGEHWIIGTTDTDWTLERAHPAASASDVTYLLEHVNRYLARPLGTEDVVGVYAGLRPLLAGESDATSKLSREHVVATPTPGLVVVAGGKYTTYRVMAADAVDAAVEVLGGDWPRSATADTPLLGAPGFAALRNQRSRLAHTYHVDPVQIDRLLGRYGSLLHEVLGPTLEDPSLAEPLEGAPGYLRAEIRYAATHEGARHLEDVLTRRTRASIEYPDRGLAAARPAAALLADVLGWDEARIRAEVAHYTRRVEAERRAQEEPDDRSAATTRNEAGDIAPERPLVPESASATDLTPAPGLPLAPAAPVGPHPDGAAVP